MLICEDEWEKEREIRVEEMGRGSWEEDRYMMRESGLRELVEDEKEKMIYVFEGVGEGVLLMEV